MKQPNSDIPVYKTESESGNGKLKVLHHNLLLPLQKAQAGMSDQDVERVAQRGGTYLDNDSNNESLVKVQIKQLPHLDVPVPAPRVFGVPRSTS